MLWSLPGGGVEDLTDPHHQAPRRQDSHARRRSPQRPGDHRSHKAACPHRQTAQEAAPTRRSWPSCCQVTCHRTPTHHLDQSHRGAPRPGEARTASPAACRPPDLRCGQAHGAPWDGRPTEQVRRGRASGRRRPGPRARPGGGRHWPWPTPRTRRSCSTRSEQVTVGPLASPQCRASMVRLKGAPARVRSGRAARKSSGPDQVPGPEGGRTDVVCHHGGVPPSGVAGQPSRLRRSRPGSAGTPGHRAAPPP